MLNYSEWSITSTERTASVTINLNNLDDSDTGIYLPRIIINQFASWPHVTLALRPLFDLRVDTGCEYQLLFA